jgi:hypothetical protein
MQSIFAKVSRINQDLIAQLLLNFGWDWFVFMLMPVNYVPYSIAFCELLLAIRRGNC